jgi:hypothetical protein
MKIKLLVMYGGSYDSYSDEYSNRIFQDISDWEEVSEADFQFIQSNLWRLKYPPGGTFVIVRQDDQAIAARISDIKSEILKMQMAEEKRKAEEQKKKEERAAKRLASKLEKDKVALKKLLEKNPDLFKDLQNLG